MSSLKLKSYPTVPVDGHGVDNSKPDPIIELRKEGCRAEGLFYRLGFAGKLYCSFGFLLTFIKLLPLCGACTTSEF